MKELKNCFKNKGIIVFKGFGAEFMENVDKEFPRAFNNEYLGFNKKDLRGMLDNAKGITKEFIFSSHENVSYAYYEELLAFQDGLKAMYDGEILVVNNNLYVDLPYDFSSDITEVKEYLNNLENEKIDNSEESYLGNYFGVIKGFGKKFSVIFKEVDGLLLEKRDYYQNFEKYDLVLEEIEELDEKTHYYTYPDKLNGSFVELKKEIEKDNIKESINILVEKYVLTTTGMKKELLILKELCEKKGINLRFINANTKKNKMYRDELKKILKTFWGSDNFRDLKFYGEPDKNTSIEEISQGIIIEDIIIQVEKNLNKEISSDIFITAPTGSGKSVLFQVPAIYL